MLDNYVLLKKLGEGAYGKVVLAHSKLNPEKKVAIKIIKKQKIIEKGRIQHTKAEKYILRNGNHPFLVSLHACF